MNSDMGFYESESQKFNPLTHFDLRIQEMKQQSQYGAILAEKWGKIISEKITDKSYPVIHPIGEETFSLYTEYPTGIYEYALHIDSATSWIETNNSEPITYTPSDIIKAVDKGNINTDPELNKPNHKNPVMVIQSQHLTDNKLYAINGNHRIYEAYRNQEDSISVYVFKDREIIPFFYDYLSKVNYFFEIDYTNVMSNKKVFLENEEDAFVYKL